MAALTGKQCKSARLLLKWNHRELAFRSMMKPHVIDQFEKGQRSLELSRRENLTKVFRKEGIEFLDFGEVRLNEERRQQLYGGRKAHIEFAISEEEVAQIHRLKLTDEGPRKNVEEPEDEPADPEAQ